ncbi:F0F1 ATP synthase subunit beta [Candidatus Saccharibacteria bacterium]|nr:F0F1 ATP synthase subunit beta [Candidatus Saccharibacteria bacterium]
MKVQQGNIIAIKGLIVTIQFDTKLPDISAVLQHSEITSIRFIVLAHTDIHTLKALNLAESYSVAIGQSVHLLDENLSVPVGPKSLGRVFNALGETVDSGSSLEGIETIPTRNYQRTEVDFSLQQQKVIETGIKVIDFFAPFVQGRKTGIIGGAGVGKTVLVTELMHNICKNDSGVSFFVGIGERIREAHELYETLQKQDLLRNTTMYLGQMNESAAMRSLAGLSAAAAARWWRDKEKKDVLFFVDNIYRYLQAGNELSTMLGETASEGGYQPTMFTDLAKFQEGLDSNANASITSVESIYIPADDISDPAVVEIYQQLDSVIVLSRDIMERGILPAVDLTATSSSLLTPEIVGERHYLLVSQVQQIMEKYNSLKGIIAIIGESELSLKDRADYQKAKRLIDYFTQSLFVTEALTGTEGQYVSRQDMLSGVEEIIAGS